MKITSITDRIRFEPEERKKQNGRVFKGGESQVGWKKHGRKGRGEGQNEGEAAWKGCHLMSTCGMGWGSLPAASILLLSMTLDNLVKERIG